MASSPRRFAALVDRIASDGVAGWSVHERAVEAERNGRDVIILSVGDPDFSTPEPIVESAVSALRAGDTHYTDMSGRPELRAAVAAEASARLGLELTSESVVITAGTQGAMLQASLCLLEEGDEVIAFEPMYLTYEGTLCVGGASLISVAQPASSGFRPDTSALRDAVNDRTRVIALTNPNNPTGVILNDDELQQIADIAIEHDLWVISDEVYADLIFDGEHRSIASIDGMAERTVIVTSLSKSHAMTGWRVGWAIGPADLISHMCELQVNINYGLPGFIQQAALDVLLHHRDASVAMKEIYRERRDLVASILAEVENIDVLVPEAGMYVMIDVSKVAESGQAFADELFDATGVALVDAGAFGPSAADWVRVAFTVSNEALKDAATRIAEFVSAKK